MTDHYDYAESNSLLSARIPTKHPVRAERLLKMLGVHPTMNTWLLVYRLINLGDLPWAQQDLVAGQINELIDQVLESERERTLA